MADTAVATYKGRFIQVAFTGAGASWDFSTDTGVPLEMRNLGRLKVMSITFIPSATADKCVITEGTGSGGPIVYEAMAIETTSGVVNEDKKNYDKGMWMRPYFDLSKSTLTTPTSAFIVFELG